MRPESTLDAGQRDNALNLRRGWLVEQMNDEMAAATGKHDIDLSLAVVARYRELLGDVPEIVKYLNEVEAGLKKSAPPASRGKK